MLLLPVLTSGDLPSPTGGLLIFVEADGGIPAPRVAVSAELRETGWPGISILELTLDFEERIPGLRWYLITSGQYQPPPGVPVHAHCVYVAEMASDGTVRCPADEYAGAANVRYRAGGLGAAQDGKVFAVTDYDGYHDTSSALVEGVVSREAPVAMFGDLTVFLPVGTPETTTAGSQTFGALAPIAGYNIGDYGVNEELRALDAGEDEQTSFLAEKTSGRLIEPVAVSSIRLELREELGFSEVTSARPPVASTDRLVWQNLEVRRKGVNYVLHDPLAANSQLTATFLAGLTGSMALTFAGLLLGPFLRRRAGLAEL
ncbi:hypothetical protein [Blastococcus montanus]|uniref:hypothetical protein n=1 Tax=Blastococcus montanus TaxID=3144973 RepID=UPI00320B3ED4